MWSGCGFRLQPEEDSCTEYGPINAFTPFRVGALELRNRIVSSGGLTPAQRIPIGPGYQVPLARGVKAATRMPVVAVGLITEFEQAEAIVGTGDADLIALARAILYNPRWPWHAAAHLGATAIAPDQYLRSPRAGAVACRN